MVLHVMHSYFAKMAETLIGMAAELLAARCCHLCWHSEPSMALTSGSMSELSKVNERFAFQ